MELTRIRYFLELCDTLNFSHAANTLGISQPALSKSIKKLEQEIGGDLLKREGKHTHLTSLGKIMRARFQEIDAAVYRAEEEAKEVARGGASPLPLYIAVLCSIGPEKISKFISAFILQNPNNQLVLLNCSAEKLAGLLSSGSVDCAFADAEIPDNHLLVHNALYDEKLHVAHSEDHPFTHNKAVSLNDVRKEQYLDQISWGVNDPFFPSANMLEWQQSSSVRSDRDDFIKALLRTGTGVSILPIGSDTPEGVSCTPLRGANAFRTVSLVFQNSQFLHPLVNKFSTAAIGHDWK